MDFGQLLQLSQILSPKVYKLLYFHCCMAWKLRMVEWDEVRSLRLAGLCPSLSGGSMGNLL
jgi:hypothetical protein